MTIKQNALRLGSVKAKLDVAIGTYIELNDNILELKKRADALKVNIESSYTLTADQKEILQGDTFYAQKVPVLTNKKWNIEGLRSVLTAGGAKGITKIIKRKVDYDVDEKAIKKLIKDNVVTEQNVYANQTGDSTFKSKFGRVEDLVAAAKEAEDKAQRAQARAIQSAAKALAAKNKAAGKPVKKAKVSKKVAAQA